MNGDTGAAAVPEFLYGTAWKEERTRDCVERALEAGFIGIDTANQRRHYHEAGVGEALQEAYRRGTVSRDQLFLQSKFTHRRGQDHRLPYDEHASFTVQVRQSFSSSLEHLRTDYLDSLVLHGPWQPRGLGPEDEETWQAMESIHREGGALRLGVSNVSLEQLRALCERAAVPPTFVQNRCFATTQWDREVREFCNERGIIYQGFSLLTANVQILRDQRFAEIVQRTGMTPAQVVFTFALQVGMLPLTGTTDSAHMREDLAAEDLQLEPRDREVVKMLAVH